MFFSIQVKSGTEYQVAKFIEATYENQGQNIIRVLIPTVETYDLKKVEKGIAKKRLNILLPSYIFIEVNETEITMKPSLYNYLKSLTKNVCHVLINSIPENELTRFIGKTYSIVELAFEEKQIIKDKSSNEKDSNLSHINKIIHSLTQNKMKSSLSIQAFLCNKKLNLSIPASLFKKIVEEKKFTIKEMQKHPKAFLLEVLRVYEQALSPC
ncbi:transcription termination/antitermination NusG family protein [Psychrobacillus sp. FSL H8-0487]|uniref:transcription termination/antitermination NusG family protein n=1 Tax=Psychrobacillus sp. FSL H8-0487 TaxID=2921391 RepID=UPI0030FD0EE8